MALNSDNLSINLLSQFSLDEISTRVLIHQKTNYILAQSASEVLQRFYAEFRDERGIFLFTTNRRMLGVGLICKICRNLKKGELK